MPTARENIERALTKVGLWKFIGRVIEEREDRIFATCLPEFWKIVKQWPKDITNPGILHPGALHSFREPDAPWPCLQVCEHPEGVAEIDLDLANPQGDVASLCIHTYEVLRNMLTGKTSNQLTIAHWLNRRFKNA